MPITAIFASILGIVFVALSLNVVRLRRLERISLGDGESKVLMRAIRAQGNFAEYTPIALILIGLAEFHSLPWWVVMYSGLALVTGRIMHGISLNAATPKWALRRYGMLFTLSAILLPSLAILMGFIAAVFIA